MAKSLCTLSNDETGSELIEFALCVPLLFATIFGIVYFSLALYANHFVANAAKDGARFAEVRGSSWNGALCSATQGYNCSATSDDVTTFITKTLPPGLAPANLSVSTSWPGITSSGQACDTVNGPNSPDCLVVVQVSYLFSFPLPFIKQGSLPFTSKYSMTISE